MRKDILTITIFLALGLSLCFTACSDTASDPGDGDADGDEEVEADGDGEAAEDGDGAEQDEAAETKRFPDNFRLGAATAAHQIEGNQTNSWTWFETLPQYDGMTAEPSGLACDSYNRYEEDFDLAKSIGLDTMRLSIEWSRIEPKRGEYDLAEIEHYKQVFEALAARGIKPSVTLHHFTEPQWFTDLRNMEPKNNDTFCANGPSNEDFCFWSNPQAAPVFGEFCGLMAEHFGKYVDEWWSFNEIPGYWIGSSVMGDQPPVLSSPDMETINEVALPILRGLFDAHAACYKALHAKDEIDASDDGHKVRVGMTCGAGMVRPADPDNPAHVSAAKQGQYVSTLLIFDAVTQGKLDSDFDAVPDEYHAEWENTLDLVGLQYYASTKVIDMQLFPILEGTPCINMDDPTLPELLLSMGCPPPPTLDFPMGDFDEPVVYGLQHDPEGLLEILQLFHDRYPEIPIVITESGFSNYNLKRAYSIVRHLNVAQQAIEQGIPLEGYYHWSLIDNFEWGSGYKIRFGLFSVDYENDQTRSPTIASQVYGEITEARGLTPEILKIYGGTGALPTD